MKRLLKLIFNSKELLKLLTTMVDAIRNMFSYLFTKQKNKSEENYEKKKQEYDKKVDKAVDSGTIEDILDLRK